jgi:probable H4MPT-linked C1 transfer pathway protein
VWPARAGTAQVASANWLALATFAGRYAPSGLALLLDVGTTTTDIVPLQDGVPVPRGRDDPSRLLSGELAYRGWRRTPLMALLSGPAVAAERFATTHDVYLALGLVEEGPLDTDTADGRPATRGDAARRIARMWCAEPDELDVFAAACLIGSRLEDEVGAAIARVVDRLPRWPQTVLLSGSGELLGVGGLAQSGLSGYVSIVSLAAKLGAAVSAAACAHAACVLCREREGRG